MGFRIEYEGNIIGNNQRYAFRRAKKNTEEYENFKTYLGYLTKQQNKNTPMIEGKIEVIFFYNSKHDVDNVTKGIFDALQGIVYANKDSQIVKLHIEKNKQIEKGFIAWIKELPDDTST